jgi:hypothetical protein
MNITSLQTTAAVMDSSYFGQNAIIVESRIVVRFVLSFRRGLDNCFGSFH